MGKGPECRRGPSALAVAIATGDSGAMDDVTSPPATIGLPAAAAAQFSYHARMAAVFAVAGDTAESASESVLAWALLATSWDGADAAAQSTADELIGQDQAGLSDADRDAARARAEALALELEAHYVSVGVHDVAALYSAVAEGLGATIASLTHTG